MLEIPARRALIAAAALTFVAGCAGGSAVTPPSSLPSQQAPAGSHLMRGALVERPLIVPTVPQPWNLPHEWPSKTKQPEVLFVADPQNNQILMYNPKTPNPSPEGSITNGLDYTFGVAVDKKGKLYAANLLGGTAGSIVVYPPGSSTPSLTITNGVDAPYGIAVDANGDIFATNLDNNTVVGYKRNKTKPFETISFSSYGQALGIAADKQGNVWVGCDDVNRVYEIPVGSQTPVNANLTGLNGTIGVAFGKQDEMYVANFSGADVQVYAYGTTAPSRTISTGVPDPTFNGITRVDSFFASNQGGNVSGYKKGHSTPFSTITGIPDPRGIASTPLVKK